MIAINRHHYDLVLELIKKEIKLRYNNSLFGYLWFIFVPLTQAIIFVTIFKFFLDVKIDQYALFLIIGLFPWQWFHNSILASSGAILRDAQLIKKMTIKRELVVYATVLNDFIHFMVSVPIIFLFLLVYGRPITIEMLGLLPILIMAQLLLCLGLGFLVASVNVFFRDLERLLSILMNIFFYLTPIIYVETMIPEQFRSLFLGNPVALLIINYHSLFLQGTVRLDYLLVTLLYGVIFLVVGHRIFQTLKKRFAEVL